MLAIVLAAGMIGAPAADWKHTEADAVGWAFAALATYPQEDWPHMRFVFLPHWAADARWIGATNLAVNLSANHATTLHPADVHANGHLLAYNLRRLAPEPKAFARLVATWDSLAIDDPYLHISRVNQPASDDDDRPKAKPVAILAPHLQEALAVHAGDAGKSERIDVLLTQMTGSPGVVYRADWLIEQLLSSLRGKYLEFRQVDLSEPGKNTSQFERHVAKRGFFPDTSQRLRGERGALMITSGVTGKSRVVQTIFGTASRQPLASTFDFKDARTRPDEQFIRNVVSFDAFSDGGEHFVPLANGLVEFLLTDDRGNIIRAAPPDIAVDFTKPDGFTKQLETGISCVTCHMPNRIYRTARNDMELLLDPRAGVDFFGVDFSITGRDGKAVTLSRAEAVDLVSGRFGERIDTPDGILGRARRDVARAVATISPAEIKAGAPDAATIAGNTLTGIYHGYRYQSIDAQTACRELGLVVDEKNAHRAFRWLVPLGVAGSEDDVIIGLLGVPGAEVKRDDWEAIYIEAARRASAVRASSKTRKAKQNETSSTTRDRGGYHAVATAA